MFYRNTYGKLSDSSTLDLPSFATSTTAYYKFEFYYYIKSSGYQALELYKRSDQNSQFQQIWRTEATPPELEQVWTYACLDFPRNSEGKD